MEDLIRFLHVYKLQKTCPSLTGQSFGEQWSVISEIPMTDTCAMYYVILILSNLLVGLMDKASQSRHDEYEVLMIPNKDE